MEILISYESLARVFLIHFIVLWSYNFQWDGILLFILWFKDTKIMNFRKTTWLRSLRYENYGIESNPIGRTNVYRGTASMPDDIEYKHSYHWVINNVHNALINSTDIKLLSYNCLKSTNHIPDEITIDQSLSRSLKLTKQGIIIDQ